MNILNTRRKVISEWKIIKDVVLNHGGQEVSQGKLGHRYLEPTTTVQIVKLE